MCLLRVSRLMASPHSLRTLVFRLLRASHDQLQYSLSSTIIGDNTAPEGLKMNTRSIMPLRPQDQSFKATVAHLKAGHTMDPPYCLRPSNRMYRVPLGLDRRLLDLYKLILKSSSVGPFLKVLWSSIPKINYSLFQYVTFLPE